MGYYSGKLMGMQAEAVSGIVTDGLKLYLDASNPASYPGTGTTWFDLSGNGNNGTMVNGVVPLSNAMQFDGVNDYVTAPVLVPSRTYTVSFWINPATLINYNQLISINGTWGGFTMHTGIGGYCWVGITASNRISSIGNNTYTLNTWQLFTFTFDNGMAILYKNGSSIRSATLVNPAVSTLSGLAIDDSSTYTINGKINDTMIYLRALAANEVNQIFNVQRSKYGI